MWICNGWWWTVTWASAYSPLLNWPFLLEFIHVFITHVLYLNHCDQCGKMKWKLLLLLCSGVKEINHCLFVDSLEIVSETGRQLGEFCVSVEKASYHHEPCYLVHANSHGVINNVPCGTSITGEPSFICSLFKVNMFQKCSGKKIFYLEFYVIY